MTKLLQPTNLNWANLAKWCLDRRTDLLEDLCTAEGTADVCSLQGNIAMLTEILATPFNIEREAEVNHSIGAIVGKTKTSDAGY